MTDIDVRVAAHIDEITSAGALTAEAYHADGLIDDGDDYLVELLDARRRASEATLLVAVVPADAGAGSVVLGTCTLAPHGTSYAELAEPGEVEVRMLAVAPEARRRGVAEALVRACQREAVALGVRDVVLSTREVMSTAQRLYERLGFRRVPDRDWHHEGIALLVYAWHAPDAPGAAVEATTWRPLVVHDVAGWQAGTSGGFTRRANSVIATGVPADVEAGITAVEQLYADHGLVPVFRLGRESRPATLADTLAARGYRPVSDALVMVHDDLPMLAGASDAAPADPAGSAVPAGRAAEIEIVVSDEPDAAWMSTWLDVKSSGRVDPGLAASIVRGSPAVYLTALRIAQTSDASDHGAERSADREPVGVIRAAIADDWVALACLVVTASQRRRGVARALTREAVSLAVRRGARRAFLQVEHANTGAITMYERLGFTPAEAYVYVEPTV